jgi:heterotetrameric sarcosine oxidase delta subunit
LILIPCPHCGPRNSTEFLHWGEQRPRPPVDGVGPLEWRSYLYFRRNPAGWTTETWFHRFGCARFFVAERHTVTNEVRATRLAGGDATDGRLVSEEEDEVNGRHNPRS